MSKVLITGGCGFVGWNAAKTLSEAGEKVVCYDLSEPDEHLRSWHNDTITIIQGDVRDKDKLNHVIEQENIKKIVHAGAMIGYATEADEMVEFLRTNIEGTLTVMEAAKNHAVEKCVFISSEEVYGTFKTEVADENHPAHPLGIYGITKFASENLMELYYREHGVSCIVLRTIWVYGPGLPEERPPWLLIPCAVRGRICFLETGSEQFSDKTYIEDLSQAILLSIRNTSVGYGVYNISSGKATSLSEMIALIKEIVPDAMIGAGPGFLKNSEKVDMPQKGILDITKAKNELGYHPEFDLKKGLRAYIDWLRSVY